MRVSALALGFSTLLSACSVTNTGNPHNDAVPAGTTLLRSALVRDKAPALGDDAKRTFGSDQQRFSFELYTALDADKPNLFFSPYSISTALAMVYAGARAETKSEMAKALSFSLPDQELHAAFNWSDLALAERESEVDTRQTGDGLTLNTTNATFVQRQLEVQKAFLQLLAQNYDAGLYLADFAHQAERERVAINRWVYDRTQERIDELLPPMSLDASTELVLVNTIYFKASWLKKFDPALTEKAPFHAPSGERSVDMMHGSYSLYSRGDGYQAVALPYVSENVRMLLVLPDEGKLADVEARLGRGLFDEARSSLSEWAVDLRLPRFSFSTDLDLVPALRSLGMQRAFDAADFSGIAGNPGDLFISGVYHQAFISVDEQGTEAAAATAVVVGRHALPQTVTLTFDRPFLFAIYDEPTGVILFAGRVSEP